MYQPHSHAPAAAYRRVGMETMVNAASPHHLVTLLFDELSRCVNSAISALAGGDMGAKVAAIGKSVRLLEEGLKAGLNPQAGGSLAATLRLLYDGLIMRLTLANARNDLALLDEVVSLISPIRDAWREIGSRASTTPLRTN